jgi:trehalose 6-phosphate synthase/phosphatase
LSPALHVLCVARKVFGARAALPFGSFVEEKTASLAWHYRRTPPTVARPALLRAREQLSSLSQGYEIELVEGAMVLEVRPCGFNQGSAVRHVLAADATAGVFAAGDDTMDEDLFSALPAGAFSVAVGGRTKGASHRVASPLELRALLGMLLQ